MARKKQATKRSNRIDGELAGTKGLVDDFLFPQDQGREHGVVEHVVDGDPSCRAGGGDAGTSYVRGSGLRRPPGEHQEHLHRSTGRENERAHGVA